MTKDEQIKALEARELYDKPIKEISDFIAPPGVTITKVEGSLRRYVKDHPMRVRVLPSY